MKRVKNVNGFFITGLAYASNVEGSVSIKLDQVCRERLYSRVFRPPVMLRFIAAGRHFAVRVDEIEGIAFVSQSKVLTSREASKKLSIPFKGRKVEVHSFCDPDRERLESNQFSTVVVLRAGGQLKGVLVEQIIGVSSVSLNDIFPFSSDLKKPYPFVDELITTEKEHVNVINVSMLFRNEII